MLKLISDRSDPKDWQSKMNSDRLTYGLLGCGVLMAGLGTYLATRILKRSRIPATFRGVSIKLGMDRYDGIRTVWLDLPADDPDELLKTIQQDPVAFIKSYGYIHSHVLIVSIEQHYGSAPLPLLRRIAEYMKLDVHKDMSQEDLHHLIDEHITYAPPHSGYEKAIESLNARK